MPRVSFNDSAYNLYKQIIDHRASVSELASSVTSELGLNGKQRVICMASSKLTHNGYENYALLLLNTLQKENWNTHLYNCAATAYNSLGQHQNAIDLLTQYGKENWNTHLYNCAATAYNGLGQHQNAENTYSEGINLDSNNIFLRVMFSLYLLENKPRHPDIIKHVTVVIQHSKQNTTPLYLLAKATYNDLCPKTQFNEILALCNWINKDTREKLIKVSKEGKLEEWEEAIKGITRSGLFSALEVFDISGIDRVAYRVGKNKLAPVEFV